MNHTAQSTPLSASPDVVFRAMPDGAVLVHLPTNRIFELNATGCRVWELIGLGHGPEHITTLLTDEFAADRSEVSRDISILIDRLISEGLVQR
jgi:hypothetical protein